MPLNKDLLEFVELFNANAVEYVIVGAFALAHHGVPRYTADLDFFIRPTSENARRIVSALTQFGFGALDIQAEDLQRPNNVIQLGLHPNRIDLLTDLSGLSFDEVWENRVEAEIEGMRTLFIGAAELLRNKQAVGRKRDLADAEELRKILTRST